MIPIEKFPRLLHNIENSLINYVSNAQAKIVKIRSNIDIDGKIIVDTTKLERRDKIANTLERVYKSWASIAETLIPMITNLQIRSLHCNECDTFYTQNLKHPKNSTIPLKFFELENPKFFCGLFVQKISKGSKQFEIVEVELLDSDLTQQFLEAGLRPEN